MKFSFVFLFCIFIFVDSSVIGNDSIVVLAGQRTSAVAPFQFKGNITFIKLECSDQGNYNKYDGLFLSFSITCISYFDMIFSQLEQNGAIGILLLTPTVYPLSLYTHYGGGIRAHNVKIPLFYGEYNEELWDEWYSKGTVHAELQTEINDWDENYFWTMILLSCIIIPLNLFNGTMCILGIRDYLTFSKLTGSYKLFWLPLVCLSFELIAAFFRLINSIDPISSFGLVSTNYASVTVSLSTPFTLSTTILINLHWNEIARKVKHKSEVAIVSMKRLKIPFIATCIFLFAFEIIVSISRVTGFIDNISAISFIISLLIQITINIYIIYSGWRLRKVFGEQWKIQQNLKKVSNLILFSTLFVPLFLIGNLMIIVGSKFNIIFKPEPTEKGKNPAYLSSGLILLGIALSSQSLCQILAFQRKQKFTDNTTSFDTNTANTNTQLQEQDSDSESSSHSPQELSSSA